MVKTLESVSRVSVIALVTLAFITHLLAPSVRGEKSDDVWAEWGETVETKNIPRRAVERKRSDASGIYAHLGSVIRQKKHVLADLLRGWPGAKTGVSDREKASEQLVARYGNMMTAGGLGVKVYMSQVNQLLVETETVLDAYLARDFLLRQREVEKVVIDNVPFTPAPRPADYDEDEDDDEL